MRTSETQLPLYTLALVSLLTLGACGGGGGGSTPAGSTPSPVISRGVVTAVGTGTVVVNGTTFNTAGATVTIDDLGATPDQLRPGMVVTINGESDDTTMAGTAHVLSARDILEGTIEAVGANTLTVMGQLVQIEDNVTRLNDDDAQKVLADANFQLGQVVEVHGVVNDDPLAPGIRASRVLRKATGEFEAKGFIVATGNPFTLALTPGGPVALSVTGSLPNGAVVGTLVEVKAAAAPVSGALTAASVTLEDSLSGSTAKVEVEGMVTVGDSNAFTVNGQRVITSGQTLFEGGPKADILPGARVEAEGPMDASGAIAALKVSFRTNMRLEGNATLLLNGNLSLLGKAVSISPFTRVDNNLALVDGAHLEVRAMPDRDGGLVATRVTVQSASNKAFLQGPISAANSGTGTLDILGTSVSTSGALFRVDFEQAPEVGVSRDTFFSQMKAGRTVVKVKWDPFVSLSAPVKEAEIEIGH